MPMIIVNRAPVLTLWAAVVAEHLGHPWDTALTLGRSVAGSAARVKARNIGRRNGRTIGMPTRRGYGSSMSQRQSCYSVRRSACCRTMMANCVLLMATSQPIPTPWNVIWRKLSAITWRRSVPRWRRWPAAMTRRNSIALAFGSTRNSARRSRQAMKDGAQRRCWTLPRSWPLPDISAKISLYSANQISTTSGGSACCRSVRTNPCGSAAWISASDW